MRAKILPLAAVLLAMSALSARAQNFSLASNLADWADCGTINIEASMGLARHWSLNAGAKYNPFVFGERGPQQKQDKQRLISFGARFWPWHLWSGWWFSAKCQYQEFNSGGFSSPLTKEGDRIGGGIGAGYSMMITKHLNLDLGLGAWLGYSSYVDYSCPRCGRIKGSGKEFFVLPNDILLSLSYIF